MRNPYFYSSLILSLLAAALAAGLGACSLAEPLTTPTAAVPILLVTLAGNPPAGAPSATAAPLEFATATATLAASLPDTPQFTSTPFPTNTPVNAVLPGGNPGAPTPYSACSGAPETRLAVGMTAHVIPQPPIPNNVRASPSTSAEQVGLLQPGETMKILDGPKCGSGLVFWYVESLETGLKGWTAEGDANGYWLAAGEG